MMGINHDLPTSDFAPRERPASEHLAAAGATGQWERRAEWLETEAKAQRDPAARARLLLAASEVRALLGDRADARRLAIQAANHQPAPPFAARQARALHQTHGDVSAVTRSLVEETRAAESPVLEAHGHYVAAEIQRLLQRDASGARINLDAAAAANPSDGRAPLQRLLLELSLSQRPPEAAFATQEQAEALASAVEVIRRLRGEPGQPPPSEYAAAVGLVDVQRALARGDIGQATRALAPLATRAGLLPAVRWLAAMWGAAADDGTQAALAAHRELVHHQPGIAARRALAARAVAAGSWEALQEALEEPPVSTRASGSGAVADRGPAGATRRVFSQVERAALAALVSPNIEGAPNAQMVLVGERLASTASSTSASPLDSSEEPAVESIVFAVERASSRPSSAAALRGRAQAEFALGRALSSPARAAAAAAAASPQDMAAAPWRLVATLEQSRANGDWAAVARDLPRLLEAPAAVAEASFVAAVFAERAGDPSGAQQAFSAALPSPSTREPATRALTETSSDGAAALRALSAHTVDPLRRALLLTEALFRLDPAAPEFDSLAEDAARTHSELPLAVELGAAAARSRGDRQRAARWLARRREHAQGADDYPLAALREALSAIDVDLPSASDRLVELMARQPDDLALVLSCERLLGLGARPRAEFRKRMAATLGPRGRQRFLAEAVRLYEAAGERSLALGQARELGGPLGELWATRLASSDAELDALVHEWHRAARTTAGAAAADLYDRLARLERRRGRAEQALAWERERLAVEPGSLEALRALDIDNMARGREANLEQTSAALFEALGDRDGTAHAFVATRLQIARGAFAEARPLVRQVHATAIPPLWALRLDAVFAREAQDDQALLATCRSLRERSSQALDAATLSLHAAEAALRLGELGLARDDIQRASELAPDDIVVLSARAEVLRENGDHAEAAEAFETLASATSSTLRQVDALYQAAVLWLDRLGNRARGMLALQEAAHVDVAHAGLLERLVTLHANSDDPDGLAELIARQRTCGARAAEVDADEELSRALESVDQGRLTEARSRLEALHELRPNDVAVLQASAELYLRTREWSLAERECQRVIELAHKLGSGDEPPLAVLRHLSALYETWLPRPERLALVYQQILTQSPEDDATRERLVALLSKEARWAEAASHQRELLARAADDAERKTRLLALAQLAARAGSLHPETSEPTEAELLLEQARRTWPDDPGVLEAEVTHYLELGNVGTARVIAERAVHAARAAIAAGRVERAPFRALEVAAGWCGDGQTALAAGAMAAAIAGERALPLPGAGARAGDPELDELTAPELLSAELRQLLRAAGSAIERAYAVEPRSLNTRAAADELVTELRDLALAFGLEHVRVLVSPDLGVDCWCLGTDPVCIVLGEPLVACGERPLLTFLVLRALKIAEANACALSRLSPHECWAVLAGFFACFGQPWPATGVDAQRLLMARNRIRPHVTWLPEPDLSARVSALTEQVLPRAEEVGDALFHWGTRVALLGVGDPAVALEALFASDPRGLRPNDEEGRVRWIAGHRSARDLVSFGVSEAYTEARRRAGLAAVANGGHPGPRAP